MMDKDTWLRNILSMVQELSDKHYQEEVWLKGIGNEISSFTEAICGLFDDYDLDGFLDKYSSDEYLSESKIKMLILFRDKLNQYLLSKDQNLSTENLLADPRWHEIQYLASQTMDIFKKR